MHQINERLDSWKAIADYLNRDIRTVRRWEKHGLPVHRVGGEPGRSVFAYRTQIDEWMKGASSGDKQPTDPPSEAGASGDARRWSLVHLGLIPILVAAALLAWRSPAPPTAEETLDVEVTPSVVVARSTTGEERWRYAFPPGERMAPPGTMASSVIVHNPEPRVLVVTAHGIDQVNHRTTNGVLRQFTFDGVLERLFSFNDAWVFGGNQRFEPPWAITSVDVRSSNGRVRTVVAAHHHAWWPSVVTILDERWNRTATFINSGWVEGVQWLSDSRIVIAGFHNASDSGMVALLDANRLDGGSPEAKDSPFACHNCRSGRPLVYVLLPRSELNLLTASEFNRASLERMERSLVVHTSEVDRRDRVGTLFGAIYVFTPDLALVKASYSDRYWDKHRALEMEGRLDHSRETCPQRDGPPVVRVWTADTGWRDVKPGAP